MRAEWNGLVVAESTDVVVVEGNYYFPLESVDQAMLRDSSTQARCPWKGDAQYFSLAVDGAENEDAAWMFPEPSKEAAELRDRVAFWKGVAIVDQ